MDIEGIIKKVTDSINGEIESYEKRYPSINIRLGKIGELIVGRAVKYSLFGLGYHYNNEGERLSFWIKRQINANEKEEGGVDFRVTVIDDNKKKYEFLIESKNWADYKSKITPNTFKKEILNRFTSADKNHECRWVVTMNKGNIKDIKSLCGEHHIDIIPLDGQLSTEINLDTLLEPTIKSFINNFNGLINQYIGENKSNKGDDRSAKSTLEEIKNLIERGVPDQIIIKEFKIREQYLYKIKSLMRGEGKKIIDRRSKEADDLRKL